ncbi:MAG: magnesium chelatase subunit D [Silicimonas sp.]|nr:magnesium chelatase subunit D [Silicimonas sp.]
MNAAPEGWDRVALVLRLFAADPAGFGGIWIRARHGPVRQGVIAVLRALDLRLGDIHPHVSDEALFGGRDLTAMLATGRLVETGGIATRADVLALSMAERATPGFAARLTGLIDAGLHGVVALDEGASCEELPPHGLTERLAFFLDLDGLSHRESGEVGTWAPDPPAELTPEQITDLAAAASGLGIASLRPVLMAARAARHLAGQAGRERVATEDLTCAAALVLAHRARTAPAPEAPPPETEESHSPVPQNTASPPEELLIDAAQAALPADLLAQLQAGQRQRAAQTTTGSGARQAHNRRGRPLAAQNGRLTSGARLDVIATLRAAAPWQGLRPRPKGMALALRPSDFRIRRFEHRSDRLLIFAVDASGSAAMARLAEAKGAVEILLGQAYARRDHVALIGFRRCEASLLLPPTRSLIQTRKRLTALPGGGGTPLAAGLVAARAEAQAARRRGMSPALILLTDGRANVALDGSGNRANAMGDASRVARQMADDRVSAMVIDTGARPSATLPGLADALAATYLPLPHADARRMSGAIARALEGAV